MNEKKTKQYIEENKTKLPLSYHGDLVYRKNDVETIQSKITISKKYNDNAYSLFRFYKSITRF